MKGTILRMKRRIFIFWSVFVAAALIRVLMSLRLTPPDIGNCLKKPVEGIGVVSEEPERKEAGQILIVSARELFPQDDQVKVQSCGDETLIRMKTKLYPRFKYGDTISFTGNLSKPFDFKSGDGRSFDYEGYLAKDDVFYEIKSASVSAKATTEKQGSSIERMMNGISSVLYALKRGFVGNLEKTLGEPHAALAEGLVVGEKAALGNDLLNDFRTVGLIHIVVLSGYNITIVAAALRRMLSFLPRVWGIVIGGIGIALFGILVGGGATVVRSCFMASIALSADLIRKDYNVVRALAFAACLMLIQNPMILLHDPSFQLSFLATLGLILLASPIESRLQFIPDTFGARGIIAATIATQIFVSPFILYMMGQLSIIGMVVNILVLPFIPVTMLAVTLTGMTGFIWHPLSQIFGWCAHILLTYELWMVEHFARLPFAAIHIGAFSGWWVVGFYAAFISAYVSLNKKRLEKKDGI